jgi:MFS transporter, DHA1 family, multidrug resistance protein
MSYTRTLLLLSLLAAFPPIATDMYLPALPLLQAQWGADLSTINLTLVLFFAFFSVSLLGYGPVSDSYGRRPVLLTGIGIYIAGSLLCGLAGGVCHLIAYRIVQAVGAASASALSMAIIRDLFEARERQQLLAHMGVIVALAPMLAPVLGGWLLEWLTWPWIFFTQASWGVLAWIGVQRMRESLPQRSPARFGQVLGRYLRLMRNRRYMVMNALMALSMMPLFAFIAGSPSIYITHFKVEPKAFGLFFGANALAMMLGSFTCGRLTRRYEGWPLLQLGYSGILAGGLAAWAFGSRGPFSFAAAMFLITFCMGLTRPMSNNLVLEQVREDIGTASSLLIFCYFVGGAGAMLLISLNWTSRMQVIALLAAAAGTVMLIGFHWMARHWPEVLRPVRKEA